MISVLTERGCSSQMLTEQSRGRERGACVLISRRCGSTSDHRNSLKFVQEVARFVTSLFWEKNYFCDWICGFSVRGPPLASSMNEKAIIPWFHRQGLSLVLD